MVVPMSRLRRLARLGRRGQTAVEYMLMLATAAAECGIFCKLMADAMPKIFGKIECMINSTASCPWP